MKQRKNIRGSYTKVNLKRFINVPFLGQLSARYVKGSTFRRRPDIKDAGSKKAETGNKQKTKLCGKHNPITFALKLHFHIQTADDEI